MDSRVESRTKTDPLPCFHYDQAPHITIYTKKTVLYSTKPKNNCVILTGSGPPNNKMLIISHKPRFPENIFISDFLLC